MEVRSQMPGADHRPPKGAERPISVRLAANLAPCAWVAAKAVLRTVVGLIAAYALAVIIGVVAFRFVDPPGSMLMLGRWLEDRRVESRWVPLSAMPPALVRAVIMSEDNQFCRHHGVDVRELMTLVRKVETTGEEAARGGSTISMQVTKNLFLWPGKSYVRKAIEIPLTLALELIWPKRRIMEVYLNIAELGPGVFGAEAAARRHFGKPAARLDEREAVLLAVSLPNPMVRMASKPSVNLRRVADVVERRVRVMGTRAACVLGR